MYFKTSKMISNINKLTRLCHVYENSQIFINIKIYKNYSIIIVIKNLK